MTAADYAHLMKGRDGKFYVKYEGDVAILYMDRGENRMNELFLDGYNAALDEIEKKENIKALITTGVGKFYCNGLDLEWMLALSANVPEYLTQFLKKWHDLVARLLTFPVLTIAAINGHCFAGGAILALAQDYRIMSTDRGWFSLNEVHLNLRFAPWMIKLINSHLTSPRGATDVVLLGSRLTAQQALEYDIVSATAPQAELHATAMKFAGRALPPNPTLDRTSLFNMKSDLNKDVLENITDNRAMERNFNAYKARFTRLTSPRASTDVIVLGRRFTAQQALEYQILEATSSPAELLATAVKFAARAMPPNPLLDRGSLLNMKADLFKEILDMLFADKDELYNFKSKV